MSAARCVAESVESGGKEQKVGKASYIAHLFAFDAIVCSQQRHDALAESLLSQTLKNRPLQKKTNMVLKNQS